MTSTDLANLALSAEETATLQRYAFDAGTFTRLRADLAKGDFPPERNRSTHTITPPLDDDLVAWPAPDSDVAKEWERIGREAIAKGQVAAAILNGGMATRFGGRVKGVVEVLGERSFLALKLADIAAAPGPVTTFLMNSFATTGATAEHLEANQHFGLPAARVHTVHQRISMRLLPDGELARDGDGGVDFYAPGHGDVFEILAASEGFQRFRDSGGRAVMVSNVDNLAATLSPRVIGAHLAGGKKVTVEVAPRAEGDKGGAPVRVDGRLEIVEGFRFPPEFDIGSVPVFNTNTLVIDADAVRDDYPLTWFRADKEAAGRKVVQFERLMGEVTSFQESLFLEVPREGPEGRFLPVKTPADLDVIRPVLEARFPAGGAI